MSPTVIQVPCLHDALRQAFDDWVEEYAKLVGEQPSIGMVGEGIGRLIADEVQVLEEAYGPGGVVTFSQSLVKGQRDQQDTSLEAMS